MSLTMTPLQYLQSNQAIVNEIQVLYILKIVILSKIQKYKVKAVTTVNF